ncbi:hypothetical protein Ciccas_009380 [Cichlidogyrus casuarinus]|uniref:Uncharacterized protein n=1 Tax=Cichlidogyrus casuarinus TaxID=1844966 RepID=A0ABD2PXF2_9PLAT
MENVMELALYLMTLPTLWNFTTCQSKTGLRLEWQWQLGSTCVLLAWLNLLVSMRKLPYFGIYVIMKLKVLKTFLQFSFIYLPMLVAFAMSFTLILGNHESFSDLRTSSFKVAVMTIGELDAANVSFTSVIINYALMSNN